MKEGDLVKLDPENYFDEDRDGDPYPADRHALGIVLQVYEPAAIPFLVEVLWPNGRVQKLYGDELLPVRKSGKRKGSGTAPFKNRRQVGLSKKIRRNQ
jgi:hypothetical protein